MIETKALVCESCGGSLAQDLKCKYCGNQNIIIGEKVVVKKAPSQKFISNCIEFEVEKKNGVITYKAEQEIIDLEIGLMRIFADKGYVPSLTEFGSITLMNQIDVYAFTPTMCVNVYGSGIYVYDVKEIKFPNMADNSKLNIKLFPIFKS